MAGWNDERRGRGAEAQKDKGVPMWVQWLLALTALGLGAWFGWVMF